MFNFYSIPVIFFSIVYTITIKIIGSITIVFLFFLFFNCLKIALKVVKKNPINTLIKNLGNLSKFCQKLDIIFYYMIYVYR